MKKSIKYISSVLTSLVLLSGCYDLDQYPADKVNSGSFWQDEADAQEGMMGVYAAMKRRGFQYLLYPRLFERHRYRVELGTLWFHRSGARPKQLYYRIIQICMATPIRRYRPGKYIDHQCTFSRYVRRSKNSIPS